MPSISPENNFKAVWARVHEQLACPACYGDLRHDEDRLVCTGCAREYPIVDGIPVLIANDSQNR